MDSIVDTIVEEVFNVPTLILIALLSILFVVYKKQNESPSVKPQPFTPQTPTKPSYIIEKPKEEEKDDGTMKVKVFFGSQTGTAEDFANTLSREAKRHGVTGKLVDLEKYNPDNLSSEKYAIFVMATYGDGEPTDNAKAFYDWLLSDEREEGLLSGLEYSVFGLGNKTYEHFNAVARKIDQRLTELGARRVHRRGEGDDDASLEDDFAHWKKEFWPVVQEHFGIEGGESEGDVVERRCKMVTYKPGEAPHKPKNTSQTFDIKNPFSGTVLVNTELHDPSSDRSCRHVEVNIGKLTYEPGDHLGVYPINDEKLVRDVAARLGADLDAVICLLPKEASDTNLSQAVVGPCTVREALSRYTDLTTPPRKAVLRGLAECTTNPEHRDKLIKLADTSPQGIEAYNTYIKQDVRTILEVLTDFPSVKVTLDYFLELMPRLAPRYYSISSSPLTKPGVVTITAVVTTFGTPTGRVHNGVCTTWLAALPLNAQIEVFVRKSSFRLPEDHKRPVIMVGPGTGLAPFRGFIHHRRLVAKSASDLGDSVLFFGCREPTKDYIYKDELEVYHHEKWISHLFVAFSRAQTRKVYVQHLIQENSELLWKLLHEQKAHFYICGDAHAMEKDVMKALKELIQKHGSKTEAEADAFIANMKTTSRLQTDTWF